MCCLLKLVQAASNFGSGVSWPPLLSKPGYCSVEGDFEKRSMPLGGCPSVALQGVFTSFLALSQQIFQEISTLTSRRGRFLTRKMN